MILPYVLGALTLAFLFYVWQWHVKTGDPSSYASSAGFGLFEQSLSTNKV